MNVESLKSELQQVLDSDVLLRKEFNTLKRSLSDYRNQLIMRDEDCKRLQVTIDVLNTKLVVMERDNTSYKSDLASFKELRGTISEQLQSKQDEIDARLEEIQTLRSDLNLMAANYELQIETLKSESANELEAVKAEYSSQIHTLKTNAHYVESGIRSEYENKLNELSSSWAEKETELMSNHAAQLASEREHYEQQIAGLSAEGNSGLEELRSSHAQTIAELQANHSEKLESLESVYQSEISHLKSALEEQRQTLTTNFNQQIESARQESAEKELSLQSDFENRLAELNSGHESQMGLTIAGYEERISTLVAEYEEKLANTLIHSNAQNSKLNEELSRAQEEHGSYGDRLVQLDAANAELNRTIEEQAAQLNAELEKFTALQSEYSAYRDQTSLGLSDQVNELNQQITTLNQNHSAYVEELQQRIDSLSAELANVGELFEKNTNLLAEAESSLELKIQELTGANVQIEELTARLESFSSSFEDKTEEIENFKAELENNLREELNTNQVEFDKLLAENTNLISEIDSAQDRVEAQDYEISLLKAELEEIRIQSQGKSDFFKETLSNKHFEITNLEANNAALNKEVQMLKEELNTLNSRLNENDGSSELLDELKKQLEANNIELSQLRVLNAELTEQLSAAQSEKEQFATEIQFLQGVVSGLNEQVSTLNLVIAQNESAIESAKAAVNHEHEAFVEKLFKQIDELNDQRMALLDEKDQMAGQLLKMNEVIGTISQQVDSEQIDVSSLNNHRKNIILANNSDAGAGRSPMKEQINDLVREIDKCIALLSA